MMICHLPEIEAPMSFRFDMFLKRERPYGSLEEADRRRRSSLSSSSSMATAEGLTASMTAWTSEAA